MHSRPVPSPSEDTRARTWDPAFEGGSAESLPRLSAAVILFLITVFLIILVHMGCASSVADPRCRIMVEGEHGARIAKFVNGSKLWKAYFKQKDPSASRKLVQVDLTTERKTYRSHGGDYDPGRVTLRFSVESLSTGTELFDKEVDVDLQSFMVGMFDKEVTREQLQEIAFQAAEQKVYPYIEHWLDLAALRAMMEEGGNGRAFVPLLEELIADPWTQADMRSEAEKALGACRGA